jgi:Fe-S oxidoreductase
VTTSLPATITVRTEVSPRHAEPLTPAALCSTCPKLCSTTCPVQSATGREAVSPWRISSTVETAQAQGWTPETLHQAASCTGCGACSRACLAGVTLPDESRAARAQAAAQGVLLPAAQRVRDRLAGGAGVRPPDAWGAELDAGTDPTSATVLLHGCAVQRFRPDSGRAALSVARATGASVRTLPAPEPCCGAALLDLGLVDEAKASATAASGAMAGAERVVAMAPSCARTIRDEWPDWELRAPVVLSAPEWLLEIVDGRPVPSAGPSVTWHAPCTLTRGIGVVDEPLAVLHALGVDVRQPAATGLATRCSGAGAAYPQVDPHGARAVAEQRRGELGEGEVVTACPGAARALGATDLVELVARVLEER